MKKNMKMKIFTKIKSLINGLLSFIGFILPILLIIGIIILPIYGYINNIVQLVNCDFNLQNSCKAEIIRLIGIPVVPFGCIIGFIDIDDNPNTDKNNIN